MVDQRDGSGLVRGMILAAAVMFWAVQLALWLVAEVPLMDTILLSALLVAVPALSLAQLPLLEGAEVDRLPAYWGSIATLWLIGTACWLVGGRVDGPAALGLVGLPLPTLAAWTLGLTTAGLATIWAFRQFAVATGASESPVLRQLLPRTAPERRVFALLSVAAGTGEELAYRGYAITQLAPLMGGGAAAVLTSVIFGVLHSYQGLLGTVRTGLLGGLLAWAFLTTGSLWPGILAHTFIDLLAGLVLAERLLPPESAGGVHPRPVSPPTHSDPA